MNKKLAKKIAAGLLVGLSCVMFTACGSDADKSASSASSSASSSQQAKEKHQIDVNKISEEVIPDLKKNASNHIVDIKVTPDADKIVFRVIMPADTKPQDALETADTVLRRYSSTAHDKDKNFASPGGEKNAYGGLYDSYDAVLEVIPEGSEDNKADWFIDQTIKGDKTNFLTTTKAHGGIARK